MWGQRSDVSFVNLQMPEWQILLYRIERYLGSFDNVQVKIYLGCYNVVVWVSFEKIAEKGYNSGPRQCKLSESEGSTESAVFT